MYKFLFIILLNGILVPSVVVAQNAAINSDGSNADASAILDVKSTNKGMLVPRMTTAQRTAIASPAKGLLVFDNDTGDFWFYNGTAWVSLTSGESINVWKKNADTVYNTNKGSVGIGINSNLQAKLHVADTNSGPKNFFLFNSGTNKPGISLYTTSEFGPLPTQNIGIGFNARAITNFDFKRIGQGYSAHLEFSQEDGVLRYRTRGDGSNLDVPYYLNSGGFAINRHGQIKMGAFSNDSSKYKLEVGGRTLINQLDVDDEAYFEERVGIGTIPTTTYALDVDGGSVRFRTATRIDGTLNPNNTLVVGQDLLVNTNKGIIRSQNSTQLKIVRSQLSFTVTNLSVGAYLETGFIDYENFGGTPQVYPGNILSYSSNDFMKLNILPVEVSSTGCKFRIYNLSSTAATVTATYQFMVLGAQ
ncbi:hypothetical protein [Lacibacter sp. H407]|uniref:hypothetical protein n=1 Tax=Lacibacter sp. H407 TaxID=3133423 RepID=UPI0030BA963F